MVLRMDNAAKTPLARALAEQERSAAWLSRKVGVHRWTVIRWAEGLHQPDEETKARVSDALGRPVAELWPADPDAEPMPVAA